VNHARLATATTVTLAGSAFAGSFRHVVQTAEAHGQDGWMAYVIAVSVELMAAVSILEIQSRRNHELPYRGPVATLTLGIVMSVAANLACAQPSVWGWVVAGWPSVAFIAVALMVETRPRPRTEEDEEDEASPAREEEAPPTRVLRSVRTVRTPQAEAVRTPQAEAVRTPQAEAVRTPQAEAARTPQAEAARTPQAEAVRTQQAEAVRTEAVRTSGMAPVRTQQAEAVRTQQAEADGTSHAPHTNAVRPTSHAPGDAPVRVTRAGVEAQLIAEMQAAPGWRPDYAGLEGWTGMSRSWCEKRAQAARRAVGHEHIGSSMVR
jgi:hypothetical protein